MPPCSLSTREEYIELAREILSLSIPENEFIYAERMMACDEGTYSLSFFEAAYQVQIMVNANYSLADVVRVVAGYVVPLENIEFQIHWEDYQTKIHRFELNAFAAKIEDLNVEGPDLRLAKRFLLRKATKDQQKLFALRVMDSRRRLTDVDRYLGDFLMDCDRNEMELAQLKKHTAKVTLKGDLFRSNRPILPPWSDVDIWDPPEGIRGYGTHYAPEDLDPEICPEAIPTRVNRSHLVASSENDAADMVGSEDNMIEEYEDSDEDSDLLEKEETTDSTMTIYLQQKGMLSIDQKAVVIDGKIMTEEIVEVEDEEFDDGNPNVLEEDFEDDGTAFALMQGHSQFEVGPSIVSTAMQEPALLHNIQAPCFSFGDDQHSSLHSSPIQTVPTVLQLIGPIHNTDVGGMNTSNDAHTGIQQTPSISTKEILQGSQTLQTSGFTEQREDLAEEHPSTFDKDFPMLPTQQPAAQNQNTTQQDRVKNVWAEKQRKKNYMNAGLGGKLERTDPTSPSFLVDVNKAYTMQDIWGYSLLGQYVGHHPGHFLINSMIKGWGVKAKYKLEEGWFIFTFNSEEDQKKVLLGGPYLIHGRPMIMKHIPDKFAFNKRDVANVPLWVRIYGLASRFWTAENLGGIASYIGNPMYMDPVTESRKRNAYARVLVEINLAAQITRKVPITFSDGDTIEVNFLVENEPKFCPACCSFGHDIKECSFNNKKVAVGVKDKLETAQHQMKSPSSDIQTTDVNSHKFAQEKMPSTKHTTAGSNQQGNCNNKDRERSTIAQHSTQRQSVDENAPNQNQRATNTQLQSVEGRESDLNIRPPSKHQRVWIAKWKDQQINASIGGRQEENSMHTLDKVHDDSSRSIQDMVTSIPLSNKFDALNTTECTTGEMGETSVMKNSNSTQEQSQPQQTASPRQHGKIT